MLEHETFHIKEFLATLPNLPGVYRMLDQAGQVLYVGKAISLKRRVSSYFQKTDLSPRILLMVKQVASIDVTVTRSEAEALILENNLIKALAPKYNILFRDDKSYPYLILSDHPFPQMAYYRGSLKKHHQYFGPYPNSYAVRDSIQILQKVFQLRTCEDSVFQHRDRACLLYQIKRCSAPCVGHISAENYADSVSEAAAFLQGKTDELSERLNQKMQTASAGLQFEEAAKYRDQLQALGRVQETQFVESNTQYGVKNCDVLAVVADASLVCVHWVSIRGGRHVGDKSFFPKVLQEEVPDVSDYLNAFVAQHYLGKPKPDMLLTNRPLPDSLCEALTTDANKKILFVHKTVGARKVWLSMAEQNARLAIHQKSSQSSHQQTRLAALAEIMQMDDLQRIECFDISHTLGEATVASCVVYDQGAMQPSEYRRFNIETAKAGDDYAAMREVLTRRYGKLQAQTEAAAVAGTQAEGKWPDLVVIDGGKGQISMALGVWAELGLHIPLVGVAKGPERKAGLEELILPDTNRVMQLPHHHPALHLLQTVRDESHRFAITGHRAKRAKARVTSSLESIPGVGTKRRQRLLARFGGLRGVAAASADDLAQVEGISPALAEKIYEALHA
ncbi:MAG: excinuclease ABC subunit UvrC [Neisseriaceae bacterium]|nr:excinuclease ABC subunit UvrC [Neisseriaceae bacterium]